MKVKLLFTIIMIFSITLLINITVVSYTAIQSNNKIKENKLRLELERKNNTVSNESSTSNTETDSTNDTSNQTSDSSNNESDFTVMESSNKQINQNPSLLGSIDTKGVPYGLQIVEDYAFIIWGLVDKNSNVSGGLDIISISNKSLPSLLGSIDTKGVPYGLQIVEDYAFIIWGLVDKNSNVSGGLDIISISDKSTPSLLGSIDTKGVPYGLQINGDYLSFADESGINLFNIKNTNGFDNQDSDSLKKLLKSIPVTPGEYVRDFYYDGTFVITITTKSEYEKNRAGKFNIIDLSDLNNPELKSSINTKGIPYKIVVEKNYVYVADDYGISLIDISNYRKPRLLKFLEMKSIDFLVDGNYLYIGTAYKIIIFNINKKENPLPDKIVLLKELSNAFTADGNYVFSNWVSKDNSGKNIGGVEIIDIDKGSKTDYSRFNIITDYLILNSYIYENYLFLTWDKMEQIYDRNGGLKIFKLDD